MTHEMMVLNIKMNACWIVAGAALAAIALSYIWEWAWPADDKEAPRAKR